MSVPRPSAPDFVDGGTGSGLAFSNSILRAANAQPFVVRPAGQAIRRNSLGGALGTRLVTIPIQSNGNILVPSSSSSDSQQHQYVRLMNSIASGNTSVVKLGPNPNKNGSPGGARQIIYQPGMQVPISGMNFTGGATRLTAVNQVQSQMGMSPPKLITMVNNNGQQVRMRKPLLPKPSSSPANPTSTTGPPKPTPAVKSKSIQMRLRSRANPLPLHSTYFADNEVLDKDADVIFHCGDGGRVRGHKLILASQSKFFTDLFQDQPIGEISTVVIPDIPSNTMKLILLLAYKNNVVVDAQQMEKVKECFDTFGLNYENMNVELSDEKPLDVSSGKVEETIHREVIHQQQEQGIQRRRMVPSFSSAQLQRINRNTTTIVGPPKLDFHGSMMDTTTYDDDFDSPDEIFKIQGYPQEKQKRKEKLFPRVETETAPPDEVYEPDEDDMIKHWMENVGKSNPDLECKICHLTFDKISVWKWHDKRHFNTGIFKCTGCDLIKSSATALWIHENDDHGILEVPCADVMEKELLPTYNKPNVGQTPKGTTTKPPTGRAVKLAQQRRLKAKEDTEKDQPEPAVLRTYKPFPQANHAIKAGTIADDDTGEWDPIKIKQLHWMYVCARCDNCSDSVGKAQIHFQKCYPDQETLFENTVTKYRQGFYGKCKCPICPRRYVSNGGFMIHAGTAKGHRHTEYRKLFVHTGSVDDRLKCVHCNRKYNYPDDFHMHLKNGKECVEIPIPDDSMPALSRASNTTVNESSSSATTTSGNKPNGNKAQSPIRKKNEPKATPAKAAPKPVLPTPPPRSARLAKRQSALLMQQVLHDNNVEDSEEDDLYFPINKRGKPTTINDYPPADCPICGSEVAYISNHLATEHKDLNVSVNRISAELLRCRNCSLTFAICDLLSHTANCGKNSQDQDRNQPSPTPSTTSSISEAKNSQQKPSQKSQEPIEIPPGVGTSPVDRIVLSLDELKSEDILLRALVCPVCNKTGQKLGDVSSCLKQHSIQRCTLCFNTYSDRGDFQQHLKECHTVGSKYKCLFCDATFINVGQAVGHLLIAHWPAEWRQKRMIAIRDQTFKPLIESEKETKKSDEDVATSDETTEQNDKPSPPSEDNALETELEKLETELEKLETETVPQGRPDSTDETARDVISAGGSDKGKDAGSAET